MPLLIYFFLFSIAFFSFLEYFANYQIRNQRLSRNYIGFLCSFTCYILVMMLWNYTNIIADEDLFYIQIILLFLSYKLGAKMQNSLYLNILNSNYHKIEYSNFLLEEIIQLKDNSGFSYNLLYFKGLLLNHTRNCKVKHCKLRRKHLLMSETDEQIQRKIINDFISYKYINFIDESCKPNSKNSVYLEKFILKYSSFLTNFNMNSVKALFEVQKILSKFKNLSYYFRCVKSVVIKDIKSNIYKKQKEKLLNFSNSSLFNEKELNIDVFLEILKEKQELEKISLKVLKAKIEFWDKYKDGLSSYADAMKYLQIIAKKITNYSKFLQKNLKKHEKSRNLFYYKYSSFLQCVLLNNINESVKFEEEVDSIKKREFTQEKSILSYITFFDNTIVLIKTSFLTNKGLILEESKTSKLANVFGYSKEELKGLKLYDLMPKIMGDHHDLFFDWYLNKPYNKNLPPRKFIETYAKRKSQLIFPVKFWIGYSFDNKDDFVLQAALKPVENKENSDKSLIFDEDGKIQGINHEIYQIFVNAFKEIQPKEIALLNIYSLVPNLQEILEKNGVFKNRTNITIRNQYSTFIIPKNLLEILEILQMKEKEETEYTKQMSYFSARSPKSSKTKRSEFSMKSMNSAKNSTRQAQFLTKLYKTKIGISSNQRSLFEQKNKENNLSNKEIIDELIDKNNVNKLRIFYDLKIHVYIYGAKSYHSILMVYLTINRAKFMVPGLNTADITKNMFSSNFGFDSSDPEPLQDPADTGKISEIQSNFVCMPPENIVDFGNMSNSDKNLSDLNINFPLNNIEELRKSDVNIVTVQSSRRSYDPGDTPLRAIEIKAMTTNQNLLTAPQFETNGDMRNSDKNIDKIQINRINSQNNEEVNKDGSFQSSHSKEKDLKGASSDKAVLDIAEIASKSASSITGLNKTYSIFKSITNIQKTRPKSIFHLFLSYLMEILFIMIYCIVIYQFSIQYITNYYDPLNKGLENFSRFTTSLSIATMATTELELHKRKLTIISEDSLSKNIIFNILTNSFTKGRNIINSERNTPTIFKYQALYKSSLIKSTDPLLYYTEEKNFIDFLDDIIQKLGDFIEISIEDQNADNLRFLSMNFQYFTNICNDIINQIIEEFVITNESTSRNILVVMIIFVMISLVIKLFQLKKITDYDALLLKMLNIFLRVNEKAAINELFYLKEIAEDFMSNQDKNDVIYMRFPEKCVNKKNYEISSQDKDLLNNSCKNTNNFSKNREKRQKFNAKTSKKTSFHNVKPLSFTKQKLFFLLAFLVLFFYFFFIYLYWIIINEKIAELINLSNFFNLLYTMPSLVQCLNVLLMRERISFSNSLEKSGEISQLYINRLNFFKEELDTHINQMNEMGSLFPTYFFNAETHINNPDLSVLVDGNVCVHLYQKGIFHLEEKEKCEELFDGSFTRGILNVLNQILNNAKDLQLISALNIENLMKDYEKNGDFNQFSSKEILGFLANDSQNIVVGEHFYEETSLEFFNFLSSYYNEMIKKEVYNMELVILVTTIVIGIITGILAIVIYKKYKRIYEEISLSLSLIPYERLINDEQTAFLIKKFIKS